MAVHNPPVFIDGGHHTAADVRMLFRALTRGQEGVGAIGDCQVVAGSTPNNSVYVTAGTVVVAGGDNAMQGSYGVVLDSTQLTVPATASSARVDAVWVQVDDPDYEGSATPDTNAAKAIYATGGSSAPPVPATAVLLATVNMPANTTTVTNSMITDQRQLLNPRRQRIYNTFYPTSNNDLLSVNTYVTWPAAQPLNSIHVPSWANACVFEVRMNGILNVSNPIGGGLRVNAMGTPAQNTGYSEQDTNARATYVFGGTFTVPGSAQGTVQPFIAEGCRYPNAGGGGNIRADNQSNIVYDIEFFESLSMGG